MQTLTLRFRDRELEKDFLESFYERTLPTVRMALLVGLFLYSIFGVLDRYIIPARTATAWFIRFAVVDPILLLVFLSTYTPLFKRAAQGILSAIIIITGFGIIVMLLLAESPGNYLYYTGLILVIMYAYMFIRLRFLYACIAVWTIVFAYEGAVVFIKPMSLPFFLNNTFFMLSANLIGMFACHQSEMSMRRDFLQRKELRELEQKRSLMEKEKILKDLHDGVGGMATSIAMLADMAQRETSLPDVRKTLQSISELACESIYEIRSFLRSLDVRELTWQACVGELRYRGSGMLAPHGVSFSLHADVQDRVPPPDSITVLTIFKIYREAITNVIKHARASEVVADVLVRDHEARISVEDDGKGLAPGHAQGRGLQHMRMRAEEIGGSLTVASSGRTRVELVIPLPNKYLSSGMEGPSGMC
jgi:signal transduction histidine kinase